MGLRTWLGLRHDPRKGVLPHVSLTPTPENYWQRRHGMRYYAEAQALCHRASSAPASVLDVGSRGCPHLEWFPTAHRRVSVDIEHPYIAEGVEHIVADFLTYRPEARFDLCLCLQVIEHVPDATRFAQHLLSMSRDLVVSVPYKWPEDATEQHCHDPIDETKMEAWFGRKPTMSVVAAEERAGPKSRRIICYYRSLE